MDRRTLIGMLAGSLLVAPLPGRAQPAPKLSRIGYISLRPGPNEFDQAFLRGMRERGWVEGQNLAIDFRWAALDRSRMGPLVTELLALQPALMVCTDGAVGAVRSQNPAMPIVHPSLGDAIKGGFTTSLSRPDGNVTGSSVFAIELAFKRIELLKEAVPSLRRVAALYTAGANPPTSGIQASIAAGKELSIEVVEMPVRLPEGIDAALPRPSAKASRACRSSPACRRSPTAPNSANSRARTGWRRSLPIVPTCAVAG